MNRLHQFVFLLLFAAAFNASAVEVVSADHQNKPDVGATTARQWIDVEKVDVIVDVLNSGVALAVNNVVKEKNSIMLNSGAGTSDLTNAQWVPLLKLYLGSATTVAELARECELDAGATTRLLDRIEAKGLCRRVRSQEDRRVVNIELTDAGRAAAKQIPAVLARVQNEHLAGFTRDEWETLKGLLRRVLENAQAIQGKGEANAQ